MPEKIEDRIRRYAREAGVPEQVALAVAEQESGFNPTLFGPPIDDSGTRAIGTFQLLPSTAASYKDLGEPTDPDANLRIGTRYLRDLFDRHQGDVDKILGEYGGVRTNTTYIPGVKARFAKFRPQGPVVDGRVYPMGIDTADIGRPSGPQPVGAVQAAPPAPPGATPQQIAALPPRPTTLWERMTGTTTELPPDIQAELDQTRARTAGLAPPAPPWNEPGGDIILDRLRAAGHAYDPRERQGRRNIAATAGAIAMAPALIPAGAGALTGIGIGALTAGGFGAAQEGVEQANEYFRGQRQQPDLRAIGGAGVEQAAMDVAGHGLLAPFRWGGRAIAGRPVMTEIAESLAKDRALILGHMDALKDFYKTGGRSFFKTQADRAAQQTAASQARVLAARDVKADAVRQARDEAAAALGRARATTRRSVAVGEEMGRGDVSAATAAGEQAQRDLADRYQTTIGQPPSESVVGRQVADIFDDPLAAEANQLGAAVRETARTGPQLDPTPLQTEARRMAMEEILPPERAFPRVVPPPAPPGAAAAAGPPAPPAIDPLLQAEVTAAERAGMAQHPVMQTIVRILNHQGPVDFYTLHQWKSQLGASLDFDNPLSNLFEGARKHLFGEIRRMLSVYEPYNAATRAYEDILETTAKGYGEQVAKNAVPEPARIVQMIRPEDPNQTRLLMNALDRHGPEVADSVREAWLHRNVLQGGLDTLSQRIQVLHDNPEFARNLLGSTRDQVLRTLDDWATAWERGGAESAERVARAEGLGRTRVEGAKVLGDQRLAGTREVTTAATRAAEATGNAAVRAEEQAGRSAARTRSQVVRDARFELATNLGLLATDKRLVSEVTEGEAVAIANSSKKAREIYDLVYAAARPTSPRGVIGLIRTLSGPKSADLLKAATADPNVNRLLIDWLADPNTRATYQVVKRLIGQEVVEHGRDLYQTTTEQRAAGQPLFSVPLSGGR